MNNEDCAVTPISDLADRALEMMAQGGSLRVTDVPGDSSFASATFGGDVAMEVARRADLTQAPAPVLWTQAQQIAFARAYDTEDAAHRGEPTPWFDDEEEWVDYRLACVRAGLAAIARHLAPGDDLMDLLELDEIDLYRAIKKHDAKKRIEVARAIILHLQPRNDALLARLSALTAQVKATQCPIGLDANPDICSAASCRHCLGQQMVFHRDDAATLRDRLARMEGALREIEATPRHAKLADHDLVDRMAAVARAALTDGGKHE